MIGRFVDCARVILKKYTGTSGFCIIFSRSDRFYFLIKKDKRGNILERNEYSKDVTFLWELQRRGARKIRKELTFY